MSLTFRSPAEATDTASTSLPSSASSTVKVRVTTELCLAPSWEVANALIVTCAFATEALSITIMAHVNLSPKEMYTWMQYRARGHYALNNPY